MNKQSTPTRHCARGSILVLTHWSYKDALIQTYTLPYVRIIRQILPSTRKITLVTSEQQRIGLSEQEVRAINEGWAGENMALLSMPYRRMGIRKLFATLAHVVHLYRLSRKENVSAIHSFCTPAGAIGYVLSKLTGAQLIIDSYEPHAEAMVENGTWSRHGLAFRALFMMERLQTHRADYFISASQGMLIYAKEKYSKEPQPFFVKPACVDLLKFSPRNKDPALMKALGLENKVVCVYAGKLGGIYLKAEVFDFLRECYNHWGPRFRFLMLTNASREEVLAEMTRVGLPDEVVLQKFVPHEEVPRYLALGAFGINPVKPVPTKKYCTSIKDGEYWATGLPVVITRDISDDSAIIEKNAIGYVLSELSALEYRNAINRMDSFAQEDQSKLQSRIRNTAVQYRSFEIAKKIYTTIYSSQ